MKWFIVLSTTCLCSVFSARSAQAIVFFENIGAKHIGNLTGWPQGLEKVLTGHPRVAAQAMDAPTWGWGGSRTAHYYFKGDQAAFNQFLQKFAKVKHEKLRLILHPGRAVLGKNQAWLFKIKLVVPFDWSVTVSTNGYARKEGDPPKVFVVANYYLADRGHLMGLEVPANVELASGVPPKKDAGTNEDQTVRAIDTFVRLHQKRQRSKQPAKTSSK